MPIGDDFKDTTPAVAPQRFHWPPPDGTGQFEWTAGTTFGAALVAALSATLKARTLARDAIVTVTIDVKVR